MRSLLRKTRFTGYVIAVIVLACICALSSFTQTAHGADSTQGGAGVVIENGTSYYYGYNAEELLRTAFDELVVEINNMGGLRLTFEDISAARERISLDPQYFYFDYPAKLSTTSYGGIVDSIVFTYAMDVDEIPAYRDAVEAAVTQALSWVDDSMTDVQKAQCLHDYLVRTTHYNIEVALAAGVSDQDIMGFSDGLSQDDKADESLLINANEATFLGSDFASRTPFNVYGVLVEHTGVCDGYSRAYQLLLKRVGIDACMVASETMNHSWNMVCIDGRWYHVDVTWDDPTPDQGFEGLVHHDYFLRGDYSFLTKGSKLHYDWKALYAAPGDYSADQAYLTVYDAPFVTVQVPSEAEIQEAGDGWYEYKGNTFYILDGALIHGDVVVDEAWRHFDEITGAMVTDTFIHDREQTSYYNEYGELMFGPFNRGEDTYYADYETAALAVDTQVVFDGYISYYDEFARLVRGKMILGPDGLWYCYNYNGELMTSQFASLESGDIIYLDENGARVSGTHVLNGLELHFDPETGVLDPDDVVLLVWW
ncbi:MAG: hypothetical protein IKE43_12790 [Coriobacteriales bacterium]|nr:hypothetical protein [Coriobacteriales bacterium]